MKLRKSGMVQNEPVKVLEADSVRGCSRLFAVEDGNREQNLPVEIDSNVRDVRGVRGKNISPREQIDIPRIPYTEDDYLDLFSNHEYEELFLEVSDHIGACTLKGANTANIANIHERNAEATANIGANKSANSANKDPEIIQIIVKQGPYEPNVACGKPALPKQLWRYGLQAGYAFAHHAELKKKYFAVMGWREDGYYIEGKL